MSYDNHAAHVRLHSLYISQIRSEQGRALAAYEALPWWERVFRRRPKLSFTGGYSVQDWA